MSLSCLIRALGIRRNYRSANDRENSLSLKGRWPNQDANTLSLVPRSSLSSSSPVSGPPESASTLYASYEKEGV